MQRKFPENFLWGAACSSHQVEGNNYFNNWWAWEKSGGGRPSGDACDHYNLYKKDFRIAKDLGHNTHRLSLEWSRLEKTPGIWDDDEWDHYDHVLDTLIDLDIEPVLTLNHFTLPNWAARQGGWLSEHTVDHFQRLCRRSAEIFSDKVRFWITINEPDILASLSYRKGLWPPCEKNQEHAFLALSNLLKAHARGYMAIKDVLGDKAMVGVAKAVTAFHPCRKFSIADRVSALQRNRSHNHAFISSAIDGKFKLYGRTLAMLSQKRTLDFIGVNYYFRQFIRNQGTLRGPEYGKVCSPKEHPEAGPVTDMGWEIYPRGLYEVLKSLSRYRMPLLVTENGIATGDDFMRLEYLRSHLKSLAEAINNGVNILGYLHWSLLDNFEWAESYDKKFGLLEVDFQTQERSIRPSAEWMAEVIRNNSL